MKLPIASILLCVASATLSAQGIPLEPQPDSGGYAEIVNDPHLDILLIRNFESIEEPRMDGYRIQIFIGSSREKANDARERFIKEFDPEREIDVDVIYEQPYFKVRVGRYRNRLEAQQLYHDLISEFPASLLITPSEIKLPHVRLDDENNDDNRPGERLTPDNENNDGFRDDE